MAFRCGLGLVVAAFLLCCSPVPETPDANSGVVALLPAPASLEGWTVVEGPVSYSAEGLFEYLNGGAPLYLKYGFEELVHVRYQLGEDQYANVTIDVFRMDSDLGAFGLYSSIRPPALSPRQWGAEGYRSGSVAAAWRGSVFVHAEADDERPELIDMLERSVAAICQAAGGGLERPAILGSLPGRGLVAGSEQYIAEDLLGHAFLPGGVVARYEFDGRTAVLFFSDLGLPHRADGALSLLHGHEFEWGEVVEEISAPGNGRLRFNDPGLGPGVAIVVGRHVAGVYGDLPREQQERLLAELAENLHPSS